MSLNKETKNHQQQKNVAQSAGVGEYTDCISAEK